MENNTGFKILSIPNQIIKEPLQPLDLSKVDAIALHHMADPKSGIKEIEQIHIKQGWRAIGYNFWVGFDGSIYNGRGFNLGAGVENQNDHIISVGFQGDYNNTNKEMPDEQFNSGIDIINYIRENIPTITKIEGHKGFMATACPGQYFPLEEMQKGEKRFMETIYNWTIEVPEWGRPTVQKLLDKGYLKGDKTGALGISETMLRILVINDRAGLYDLK